MTSDSNKKRNTSNSKNANTKKTSTGKTTAKKTSAKKSGVKRSYSKKSGSKRKKSKKISNKTLLALIITVIAITVIICAVIYSSNSFDKLTTVKLSDELTITEDFLTPNEYSRPQTPVEAINGIVVHYTANPGSTAIQNRNYFEGLKDGTGTYASSHFIIGLDGEIIQCMPLTEVAYASNERNTDTISIECCHPDDSGEFTKETYDSLVKLTSYLCMQYNLSTDSIIRHYDITGKICPKYFVDHEDKWIEFLSDVSSHISSLNS